MSRSSPSTAWTARYPLRRPRMRTATSSVMPPALLDGAGMRGRPKVVLHRPAGSGGRGSARRVNDRLLPARVVCGPGEAMPGAARARVRARGRRTGRRADGPARRPGGPAARDRRSRPGTSTNRPAGPTAPRRLMSMWMSSTGQPTGRQVLRLASPASVRVPPPVPPRRAPSRCGAPWCPRPRAWARASRRLPRREAVDACAAGTGPIGGTGPCRRRRDGRGAADGRGEGQCPGRGQHHRLTSVASHPNLSVLLARRLQAATGPGGRSPGRVQVRCTPIWRPTRRNPSNGGRRWTACSPVR